MAAIAVNHLVKEKFTESRSDANYPTDPNYPTPP